MPEFTNDPLFNDALFKDADWTDGSSDLNSRDLEARLFEFAATPEVNEFDATDTSGVDAEQSVIEASELLPTPRGSLRDDFIAEVAKIEQRRERVRKIPVAVAFLLLVSVCVLWPGTDETRAAAVVSGDNPLDRLPVTNTGPAAVVSASQKSDSWALVEAYASIREKRSATIRKSFSADESL